MVIAVEDLVGDMQVEFKELSETFEQMPGGVALIEVPSGKLLFHNREAIPLLGRPESQPVLKFLRQRYCDQGATTWAGVRRMVPAREPALTSAAHPPLYSVGRRILRNPLYARI
jgi:hypothetical protein